MTRRSRARSSSPSPASRSMDFGTGKAIARRVAQELRQGWAVNLGFGVSANVPRIFIEEGLHGQATWVIEQGAVGGVPLLEFQFGCASNAEAFVPSAYQFTYFQAAGFDCSLLSFLQIDQHGSVNVSKLGVRPHVTAGAGGFVDITSRARRIVYLRLLQCRRQDGDRRWQAEDREGRQGQEAGEGGGAGLLLRQARRVAGPGRDLCHRALRDEADARGHRRHRDRTGRRTPGEHPRSVGIPADRFAAAQGNGQAPVPTRTRWGCRSMADTGDNRIRLSFDGPLATLRIARPEKLNALDYAMVLALERAAHHDRGGKRHALRHHHGRGRKILLRRGRHRGVVGAGARSTSASPGCATATAPSTRWPACASRSSQR